MQVCDVVDRVMKSPIADLILELNPVSCSLCDNLDVKEK